MTTSRTTPVKASRGSLSTPSNRVRVGGTCLWGVGLGLGQAWADTSSVLVRVTSTRTEDCLPIRFARTFLLLS